MKVHVKVQKSDLLFSSPQARAVFFEKNKGKNAYLTIDDSATENMRRYFEGALVPAVFYQHPKSGWADFREAREALKLEFIPTYVRSTKGERVKVSRSTTVLTKEGFTRFLESINRWLIENGLEAPDPDDYKAWRDSAPGPNEIYPPLERMKALFDKVKQSAKPAWRQ